MRPDAGPIWSIWNAGGPFIGDKRPHSRVTVETGWSLNLESSCGSYPKTPVRWFQRANNDQAETEVPNIKSIEIDRSMDTDAATCTIVMYNQKMLANAQAGSSSNILGQPGYFTWRGATPAGQARWGTSPGAEWNNVLVPDALLRTFQGYGGHNKSIAQAVGDGNLVLSGVWLVDAVRVLHNGTIELRCRDMAKLLIEQHLYPPLVPSSQYPQGLRYCRYFYNPVTTTTGTVSTAAPAGGKRCVYEPVGGSEASASDCYQGFNGGVYGHHPTDAFDQNPETYWMSVGNDSPYEPYAVEWIEASCGDWIDTVNVYTWGGGYRCYVSIMENGSWVDEGAGWVDYDPAGVGIYVGANTAVIPFVTQVGVAFDAPNNIGLPRAYKADKVRFTFSNLMDSGLGEFTYRAGVRELATSLSKDVTEGSTVSNTQIVQSDGNYRDYTDIIKDLALWSGFLLQDFSGGDPQVYGNLEYTGIADTGGCVTEDIFDKKPVIDAMKTIRDIVGYGIWVDDEGGFHFESLNWFESGNFLPNGSKTSFIPNIDEQKQLTEYAIEYSDAPLRSEIIISSSEPSAGFSNTVTTTYSPGEEAAVLRGIVKTMALINQVLTDPGEQQTMARLIALHIKRAAIAGSLTCAGNPCISTNDQVLIHERVTGETGVHYVRGVRAMHDLDGGSYTMSMQTFRLSDDGGFTVTP